MKNTILPSIISDYTCLQCLYFDFHSLSRSAYNKMYMLQKLGRRLIFGKCGQRLDVEEDEKRKKLQKFKESAWKCVYFLSAELLALSVTHDEPWFTNTKYFWVGPGSQIWPDQQIK